MGNICVIRNGELYHHGILGMKWGIRRFQKKDGSLTTAGKKRYASPEEEEAAKKAEYEAGKQKALSSGSAQEVLKYKGDLTPQEMQSAIARIRWENDMRDLSAKELAKGKSQADKIFENTDKIIGYAKTGAKAWNTFANIYNAFSGTDKVSLPKIDTNIDSGNKDTRKNEKKALKDKDKNSRKSLGEVLKNLDKMSDAEVTATLTRATQEEKIRNMHKKHEEDAAKNTESKSSETKPSETKTSETKKSVGAGKSIVDKLLAKPNKQQMTIDDLMEQNGQMSMDDLFKKK